MCSTSKVTHVPRAVLPAFCLRHQVRSPICRGGQVGEECFLRGFVGNLALLTGSSPGEVRVGREGGPEGEAEEVEAEEVHTQAVPYRSPPRVLSVVEPLLARTIVPEETESLQQRPALAGLPPETPAEQLETDIMRREQRLAGLPSEPPNEHA